MNRDATVDFADINPFVLTLSNVAGYEAAFPDCSTLLSNINADATYGEGSFGNINPFVDLMTHLRRARRATAREINVTRRILTG